MVDGNGEEIKEGDRIFGYVDKDKIYGELHVQGMQWIILGDDGQEYFIPDLNLIWKAESSS